MKKILNQRGLTLVETIVSGAIGAIVAGMLFSIISMQSSIFNEGVANSQLSMQSIAINDQIARSVRAGNLVLKSNEVWSTSFSTATFDSTQTIFVYSSADSAVAYRIFNAALQESTATSGWKWRAFHTGATNARVDSCSFFCLSADRKYVTLYFQLLVNYKSASYSLQLKGDTYRCRR